MSLLNKKQKAEFDVKYQELMEIASAIKADADGENYISTDSYEEFRDSYRFFLNLFWYSMLLSLFMVLLSAIIVITKEPSNLFATSRDGYIFELSPIKAK